MLPDFAQAISAPLQDFERHLLEASARIERWFRLEWQDHTPPFYASVDLRNAGFKIAPVDTNLFPAGFDSLSEDTLPLAVQAAMAAIEKYCPDARNLLLIPDARRRDARYLRSLRRLSTILRQTGLRVRYGSVDPALASPVRIDAGDGETLLVEPLVRRGFRVGLADFDPCSILLNDDLPAGLPEVLANVHEQVLLPPLHAGWALRRKSRHFAAYAEVARRFARQFDFDPWLVTTHFVECSEVDFVGGAGVDRVAAAVDRILRQARARYREHGIDEAPFAVVKANAGTCGIGVTPVRDAAQLRRASPAERQAMASGPSGRAVDEVVVQEGVRTVETVDGGVAEPVVYTIDRYVVGGFYRVHTQRGPDENLNAPGMHFVPLPFAASCHLPDHGESVEHAVNRFYVYGVVARLALLAAAVELEQTDPDPSLYG
ncbi:MAG: glutamate--cysteine ligase [Burkholderiaceae bacterium]|nr:glutamate--cysteine ligase [Burkholderiaceae bacterium]